MILQHFHFPLWKTIFLTSERKRKKNDKDTLKSEKKKRYCKLTVSCSRERAYWVQEREHRQKGEEKKGPILEKERSRIIPCSKIQVLQLGWNFLFIFERKNLSFQMTWTFNATDGRLLIICAKSSSYVIFSDQIGL